MGLFAVHEGLSEESMRKAIDESGVVEEIHDDYQPWFTPVLETFLQGEIPGELESLLFCVQTGIGTGVIAFFAGRMYERKRLGKEKESL